MVGGDIHSGHSLERPLSTTTTAMADDSTRRRYRPSVPLLHTPQGSIEFFLSWLSIVCDDVFLPLPVSDLPGLDLVS
ncbi:hypothetical protein L6452_05588 [Arctium lappa]|uniref:Uncharacterized protein n=1 Tax=Arctium lappa TaxID=4217 RepID=A0ACB9EH10_ARCLA|nr:hypothetical protein L6452_05588 [Arctium lappa]